MRKLFIIIFILVVISAAHVAQTSAAPTSTIVQNLIITAIKPSSGTSTLVVDSAGLVTTSTAISGGSGSGFTDAATSTSADTFTVSTTTSKITITIPPAKDQYFAPSTTIATNNNQLTNGAGYISTSTWVINASGTIIQVSNGGGSSTIGVSQHLSSYNNDVSFVTQTTQLKYATTSVAATWTTLQQFSGSPLSLTVHETSTFNATTKFASSTASRCARFDADQNLVSATGDCSAGDTTGGFTNGTDGQVVIGVVGGNGTSTDMLSVVTSTGAFTVTATTSLAGNVSTTLNMTIGGTFQSNAGQTTLAAVSSTNMYASGYLTVVGQVTAANVSSTNGVTAARGQFTTRLDTADASSTNAITAARGQFTTRIDTGAASTTNLFASGYLQILGVSYLASASTTGNVTIGGTFQANAGQTTLASASSTNFTASGYIQAPTIKATTALTLKGDGVSTSTGGNPTATAWTTAVNGTANTFLRSDGAPALDTRVASTSFSINYYDATSTPPYNYIKYRTEVELTIREITCTEANNATTTLEIYRSSAFNSTTSAQLINPTIACGIDGTTDRTFTSSTIPAGGTLIIAATSTAGTPKWTVISFWGTK